MRKYLFEFEDFDWYPASFRNIQTDFLQLIMQTFDVFVNVYPKIFKVVKKTNHKNFIDFCSGGGGVILHLRKAFKENFSEEFNAVLTDKYPNVEAFKKLNKSTNGEVKFSEDSVDVTEINDDFIGFWTVFNAFHHLSPFAATKFLNKAVEKSMPIAIVEPLDKNIFTIFFQSVFLVLFMFLSFPFLKTFTLKTFLFTYLIPVIPFCVVWDGWISVLKVYRKVDVKKMVSIADQDKKYTWEIGLEKHKFGKVSYIIGYQN